MNAFNLQCHDNVVVVVVAVCEERLGEVDAHCPRAGGELTIRMPVCR